jgi:glycosyltransferase 2 family protein
MNNTNKKKGTKLLQLIISALISFGVIGWLAYSIEWNKVSVELAKLSYWYFIPAILGFYVHFVVRALRWHFLLPQVNTVASRKVLYDSILVGGLASFVLPFRLGEFVRPFMLSRLTEHTFTRSFISVVIERFFDLSFVLIAFVLMVALSTKEINPIITQGTYGLSILAIGLLVFLLLASFLPNKLSHLVAYVSKLFLPKSIADKIIKLAEEVVEGTSIFRGNSNLGMVVLLTLGVWITTIMRFWIISLAFPSLPSSILLSTVLTITVALAVATPALPGFIGVYELGCLAGFYLLGINESVGTAFALVSHVVEYILICSFGAIGLFRNGLKLGDLRPSSSKFD